MREGPDIRPADTPTTSVPMTKKRPCASTSLLPTHPPPKVTKKDFWTTRTREIPLFRCNPWDFYEPFLKMGSGLTLVLCNNGTGIRVMTTFDVVSEDKGGYRLPQVQHPNFVDICEYYLFEDVAFIFTEYVGFSIEDLLLRSIYPTEREIAYIISQIPPSFRMTKSIPSADLKTLSTVMLQMMNGKIETLEVSPEGWL
ncbi:hypothetical protein BKA61DRAFT_581394 [Leptodontidium sp. MPI-SDFR-AT-0119]|nr:hypothetical protein BKA61DRAFT_581394 [Leptodontidium sp. MPI-SDFR-AT-0119]